MKQALPAGEPLPIISFERELSARIPGALVGLMTVAFGITFAWLSVSRHLAYQSHAFDLGNMDQAVWNTLHGHFLRFTDMDVSGRVLQTRLAIHVEPLLAALAPLYLIHSGPETLLVVQSLVVATGAVPAYLLALRTVGQPWLALVFPLAYLLHPSLQNALLDDFHAVTLTASLLFWAVYFAYRGWTVPFAVMAVLAMASKEEIGLIVALLGVLLLYRRRSPVAYGAIVAGVLWFVICIIIIIPHFNPAGQSPYVSRYRYLGHGIGGIASGIVRHPDLVFRTLTSIPRLQYLRYILEPVGFTSILGLPILLLAVPGFLINLLSSDPRMYSGFYQYSAEIVPFTVASSAIGVGWLGSLVRRRWDWLAGWVVGGLCLIVLLFAAEQSWRFGFTPASRGYSIPSGGTHQALENALLRGIPANAVVAAADEIEPHLSDRSWIYLLPTTHPANGPAAQYLVLDASVPSAPVGPSALHNLAMKALANGYGVQSANDGILILRRGVPSHTLPSSFYRFIFSSPPKATTVEARWGPLSLTGVIIHPGDGIVDRSRPAIGVETYWRVRGHLPSTASIDVYLTPVYSGAHPKYSSARTVASDSPTLDWLPLTQWPQGRTIRADMVPLTPLPYQAGKVDVELQVNGLGPVVTAGGHPPLKEGSTTIVLATVDVEG